MARWMAAAMALALAGCGDGADETPSRTTSIKASNPHAEQLKELSELNRGLALRRAIQDSGSTCKKVERSSYQQEYRNLSMWTARCSDQRGWAVFIAPSGDVQVRECKDASALGLPECRIAL